MKPKKHTDIELMRILATFFVIFNHTGENGFFLFSLYDSHTAPFCLYLPISIFCKFSVPLFFMITGALMLKREPEALSKLWKYRIGKIAGLLLFWSFLYYIWEILLGRQSFDILHFFQQLLESNWNFSYWYLYAYIALLISLPLLQKFAKALSDKDYFYLIALFFVFSAIIPVIQYLFWNGEHTLNNNLNLGWICSSIFFYPMLGYFLQIRRNDSYQRKEVLILWIINVCTILLSAYMTYFKTTVTGICDEDHSQTFLASFVGVNSTTIFVSCKFISSRLEKYKHVTNLIHSVGGCTLGIYLLHVFYMRIITRICNSMALSPRDFLHLNYMLSAFLYCIVVFMCSYISTYIMKKIPLIRKLVS